MKINFIQTVAMGFCLAFMTACGQPQPPAEDTTATDEAAVRQADLDWSESAEISNWSDSTGYFSFLLDDVIFLPPNEPRWDGKATVKEKLSSFFSMPGFSARWQPNTVSVSGDLGYSMGNYDMLLQDSTGNTSVLENGKYLVAWKRQSDGKWKVAAESFSSNSLAETPAQ